MSNALQTIDDTKLMSVLESSLYPGASHDSIRLARSYCDAAGLDIMQKPVHLVPMWDSKAGRMRDVVMPGIGLYRIQAARSGEYAGVSEPEFGPDVSGSIGGAQITYPQWCKVTVRRRLAGGQIVDFTAKEFWVENYAVRGGKEKSIAPNTMWQKRPYGQIAKCAEAQALRKAFPEIGSQPTAEEMEGKQIIEGVDTQTGEIMPQAPPEYPTAEFEKNFPGFKKAIETGKKAADDIIAMVQTKGQLSAQQIAALRVVQVVQDAEIKTEQQDQQQ